MAVSAQTAKPLRVLVSEGNSTSAREAITILGLSGHRRRGLRSQSLLLGEILALRAQVPSLPGLRDDPAGFLGFVEHLLMARHFDVLLPIHEQGFLFARVQDRLADRVGLALPSFADYRIAHDKAGFSRLLDRLGLPQPATRIVTSEAELRAATRFPCVVKTSVGTASRGVWFVRDAERSRGRTARVERERRVRGRTAGAGFRRRRDREGASRVLPRPVARISRLPAIAAGAGGGEAIKQSVERPQTRALLAAIGENLAWHGALSVDTILPDDDALPLLIDCNPRLVEPMSAYLAGVDLVGLLLKVSLGETPPAVADGRAGVRTHLAMQALLGCAARGGTRREFLGECWRLFAGRGPYADSTEELTPVRLDWLSAAPLSMLAMILLAAPKRAASLARGPCRFHPDSRKRHPHRPQAHQASPFPQPIQNNRKSRPPICRELSASGAQSFYELAPGQGNPSAHGACLLPAG